MPTHIGVAIGERSVVEAFIGFHFADRSVITPINNRVVTAGKVVVIIYITIITCPSGVGRVSW